MSRSLFTAACTTALLTLTACAGSRTDSEKFATMQAVLKESPTMRAEASSDCVRKMEGKVDPNMEMIGALMKVETSRVPSVLCPRMVDAIAAGRLTSADVDAMKSRNPDPELVRRIVTLIEPPAPGGDV